jgi:hypothetical protein
MPQRREIVRIVHQNLLKHIVSLLRQLQVVRRIQVRHHLRTVRRAQVQLRILIGRIDVHRVLKVVRRILELGILESGYTLVQLVAGAQTGAPGGRHQQKGRQAGRHRNSCSQFHQAYFSLERARLAFDDHTGVQVSRCG